MGTDSKINAKFTDREHLNVIYMYTACIRVLTEQSHITIVTIIEFIDFYHVKVIDFSIGYYYN